MALFDPPGEVDVVSAASKRVLKDALAIGSTRAELLSLELQEAGLRVTQIAAFTLAAACLGLLSGIAITAAVVLLLWETSPIACLAGLALGYGIAAALCFRKASRLRSEPLFATTLDQLQKDCTCLSNSLD